MMEAYCDVIVLRHPEPGAAKVYKKHSFFPYNLLVYIGSHTYMYS